MPGAFDVPCPVCHSTLTISPEARSVVSHKEAIKPKAVQDLDEAARALSQDNARRAGLFNDSVKNEKMKSDKLKKSFDDLFKRAQDEPLERPVRDMDLD